MVGNIIAETPWEIARLGKFTSSRIDDLFTEPKAKEAKERGDFGETGKSYIIEKASEIITGTRREVSGASIEWGNLYEPEAGAILEQLFPGMKYMGKENPQFFPYTDFSGGSPDGASKVLKMVAELKCPEIPANHIKYCLMRSGDDLKKSNRDYYHQLQMNMVCCAIAFGYNVMDMQGVFLSYCPIVMDPYPKTKTLIIYPDVEFIEKLPVIMERAELYLAEVVAQLRGMSVNTSGVLIAEADPSVNATIVTEAIPFASVPITKLRKISK